MLPEVKEIEILRLGKHTARGGEVVTFTPQMAREIVETYDPGYFRAPLIISHRTHGVADKQLADYSADDSSLPASKHLAFGFPKELKIVGDRVKAVFDKISPRFVQMNRDGELLSISPSFYKPDSPSNPYPGKWSLRHVAGLGSEPPAIKGLNPLSLSELATGTHDGENWAVPVDFSAPDSSTLEFTMNATVDFCGNDFAIASVFQGLREWLIDKYDMETADRVLPAHLIDMLKTPVAAPGSTDWKDEEIGRLQGEIAVYRAQLGVPVGYSDHSNGVEFMQGNKVKFLMAAKKIDVKTGATATGLEEARLQAIMDGEAPSDDEAKAIAKALEVKVDALMNKKETETADMSEVESERDRWKQEAIEAKTELRKSQITSFCEGLVRQGKLAPAQVQAREVEFGEGKEDLGLVDFMASLDPKQEAFFKSYLQSQPQTVSFSRFVTPEQPAQSRRTNVPHDAEIEPEQAELDAKIVSYAEEHNLSYAEAYSHVLNGN